MKPAGSTEVVTRFTKSCSFRHWTAACLSCIIVVLLALSACTPIKVRLGMKVYLEKLSLSSLSASLPNGPGVAPGEKSPLVVTFTQPDGKVLQTEGAGHGKVLWSDLAVTATIATVNKKGIVTFPRDPRISDGKVGHITIVIPSHPDLHTELDVAPRYNYAFSSNFNGSSGFSGLNGSDGTNGSPGSTGSTDPNNPSAGGNGGDGTDGSNGQDGGPGGDAPPVEVRVALRSGSHPLLQIRVSALGRDKYYLVDPQGGSLNIHADGGAGGSGGRGGRGGQGGSGGIGIPSGSSGRNGLDGRNGFDGPSGRGGTITVTYDPKAKPFLGMIHLSSRNGPRPVLREEDVAALW